MAAIACGMDSGMFSVPSCVCRLECRPHAAISGPWSCWPAANLLDKEAIEEATRQRCFHVFKNVQEGGIKIDPDPMMALAKTLNSSKKQRYNVVAAKIKCGQNVCLKREGCKIR